LGKLSNEDLEKSHGFLKSNKAQQDWCIKDKKTLSKLDFEIEKPGQGFYSKLMDEETS